MLVSASIGQGFTSRSAMSNAEGPLSRTVAMALLPAAVDRATIVSPSPGGSRDCAGIAIVRSMLEGIARLEDAYIRSANLAW